MRISDWSSDVCSSDLITLVTETVLEHEGEHAGAGRIVVGPDMAGIGEEAVGLAFGEGRVGEEGGGERLKGETDAELLGHVGFGAIVEIGLDGAGSEHHVEAEIADLGHVAQHDLVAALGHDGEVGAGLVRPHAEARSEENTSELQSQMRISYAVFCLIIKK